MMALEILLVIVTAIFTPLLWLMFFSDLSMAKHKVKMEALNISHAQDMQRLHGLTAQLFPPGEREFAIFYLVPTKHQPLWARLTNRIRIYPFTFRYSKEKGDSRTSEFTKTISKSKWFYMQLKKWAEITDRDAAVKAMWYLNWKRDLP